MSEKLKNEEVEVVDLDEELDEEMADELPAEAPKKTRKERWAEANFNKENRKLYEQQLKVKTLIEPENQEAKNELKLMKHEDHVNTLKKVVIGFGVGLGTIGALVGIKKATKKKSSIDVNYEEVSNDETQNDEVEE